ncbi:MAG: response regulator [Coriobacteriales bacterium]|jgi:putative two-component system response regulator|nr:response regulator [Coriobacteriales bacterium]
MTGSKDKAVILTVDDDPIILNAVLEVLKHDYTVRPFTSGEAAISFLKDNHADLILLDHNMPSMTGIEVLKVLQSDPATRSIPVIFLTGSVDSEDEVRALQIGAMDYLLKPFRPGSLLTRVRLQLELYNYRYALERLVELQTEELRSANQKLAQRDKVTLDLLAKASDMRDHETGAHIERVVLFTDVIVGDLLANPTPGYELSEQYGRDIVDAVKLHDLGKLAMPDNVLLKPGKLTKEEFDIIKTHPIYGSKMLSQAIEKMGEDSLLWTAFEIVYGHHEKWDGSGYPNGAKGDKIPLSARIAAVADVFDALTSSRPYKNAWKPRDAFDLIYSDAGKHFDPYLTEVVKRHEEEFAQIVTANRDIEQLPTPELDLIMGAVAERAPADKD